MEWKMRIQFYRGVDGRLQTEEVVAESEWAAETILRRKYEDFTGIALTEFIEMVDGPE